MPQTPRALLAALVTTTIVITAVLCGFGWLLLNQQREIDDRREAATVDGRAEAVAAAIRGRLADAGDRLSAWLSNPTTAPPAIEGAVVLTVENRDVRLTPVGGLPFVPVVTADNASEKFRNVEAIEHREHRLAAAADGYRALMSHADEAIRAGALQRLARVLRKSGEFEEALRVADALVALGQRAPAGDVRVGDVPAEVAGLVARRAALLALHEGARADAVALELQRGLDAGRWRLLRGDAEAYRDEVSSSPRPESWRLASFVTDAWSEADGSLPARGCRAFTSDGRPAIVLWRASGDCTVLVAAHADAFLAPVATAATAWRVLDADDHVLLGADTPAAPRVERLINAEYPWKVEAWADGADRAAGAGRNAVLAMLAVTLVFVWGTTYVMGRAIRREAAVSRLQADFVAAVSHEFRLPLTTVRQVTEMLESERLPSEGTDARRKAYYSLLTGETTRLQRLVETLLNFGRMEAGAVQYRLEDVEASGIVRSVVRDFEAHAQRANMSIDVNGDESGVVLRADETALATALRNLIDNAIKYSPGQPSVRVTWAREGDRVAIRVSDSGPGIPAAEQRTVFEKFVRGEAAIRGNVRGTGVGLAMVRQIVVAHGGEIHLESRVGQGSTFTILLPAAVASSVTERVTA